jgi:LuxR family transcriptional regulator, maltose regulon positive regulatory protein
MRAPGHSDVAKVPHQLAGAAEGHRESRTRALDLVAAKLLRPPVRRGSVSRSSLIERLVRDDSRRIISVVAPPGYGKTTLLSQWAERSGAAFAWVSVDEGDNDPKVLLTYIAEALDALEPIDQRVFDALASPYSSVPGSVIPRLASALWSMSSPVVLVLDDVHLLRHAECRTALSVLADSVPGGSRLVLAGRAEPPLRIARLRAEDRIFEISSIDLSFTVEESVALLRDAGIALSQDEMAELHRRTEGWPVGLYLAALYLSQGGSLAGAPTSFGGDDQLVSEYIESEMLERISGRHRVFLTRTAVLERVSGPLCEAVLQIGDGAAILTDLARSNLLLVPLDRRGRWYRYHHLFRDMLLAELERLEPGLMPVLRRRAAAWCLGNGRPEEALEYCIAAGDTDTAARLVLSLWLPTYRQGRVATIQRWQQWLESRGAVEGYPMVAVMAALMAATTGRPAEAERWAQVIDSWQDEDGARPDDPAAEAWAAVLRAVLCRHGIEQMRHDADEAVRKLAAAEIGAPVAALCQGIARVLSGDLERADEFFEDAVQAGRHGVAPDVLAGALSEQSLLAMAGNQWDRAESLAGHAASALGQAGIEESEMTPLVRAAQARAALHQGDVQAVRQHLVSAQRTRPRLTYAIPHIALQARIELTRVHLALGDRAAAKVLMRESDELLRRRPSLGTLTGQAQELRAQLSGEQGPSTPGASALTGAELRLLPWLATHLSFPQIAAEMFLSPTTIKSQAYSLYRKLGVSSRNQAVTRSRDLALLG